MRARIERVQRQVIEVVVRCLPLLKILESFTKIDFVGEFFLAQSNDDVLPDGAFFEQAFAFDLHLAANPDKLGRTDVRRVRTSEAPDELKCVLERLVRHMDRGNLESWKIEALAQHVDANDAV